MAQGEDCDGAADRVWRVSWSTMKRSGSTTAATAEKRGGSTTCNASNASRYSPSGCATRDGLDRDTLERIEQLPGDE